MKIKVENNDILCADFETPIKIGEFNDECIPTEKKYLALVANMGQEFISLYQTHKNNMHISNILKMLEKMDYLYNEYDYERTKIRRNWGDNG